MKASRIQFGMALGMLGLLLGSTPARGGTLWVGNGVADAKWTTATNWNNGVLPVFDGTADITVGVVNASGAVMELNGNKDINSLLGSAGSPASFVISNNTLTVHAFIRKTGTTQIKIASDLELAANVTLKSDQNANTGILLAGAIKETSPNTDLIIENSLGVVQLWNTNNTYTGNTIIRRGQLDVSTNAPASGAGAVGNSGNPVLLGDTLTGANNWPVTINLANGISFARPIKAVATGSSSKPIILIGGSSAGRTSTLILDRDSQINYGQPGNGTFTGYITGTGGFERVGGGEILTLSCVTNDFTGDFIDSRGPIIFAINGTTNALGIATTTVVIASTGASVNRGLYANGTGTFARAINVTTGNGNAAYAVTLGLNSGGPVLFTGDVALNTPDQVYFSAPNNNGTVEFSGAISGTSTPIRIYGHTGSGNRIRLSNTNNTFTGQIQVQNGCLFVPANSPLGGPGPLGANSTINMNSLASGVNYPILYIDGPYTIGQDIAIPTNGFAGEIVLGGSQSSNTCYLTGAVSLGRTNHAPSDCSITAGRAGRAVFSGKITGAGSWYVCNPKNTAPLVSYGGDVEFTNPSNTFSGLITVAMGHFLAATTGAEGTGTNFVFGDLNTFANPFGVLTTGPAIVNRSGTMGTHINVTGAFTLGGLTPHESRFTGNFNLTRAVSSLSKTYNYLLATNGATVHVDGTLFATNAGYGVTKIGNGRVNINSNLSNVAFTMSAGILGGSGLITNALTFSTNMTFSPGSPLGTLTVSNNVIIANGGTFLAQITNSAAGMAEVWGNVDLSATNDTISAPNLNCPDRVIVRYHGTLSGRFNVTNLPPRSTVSYGTGTDSEIRLMVVGPPPKGTIITIR